MGNRYIFDKDSANFRKSRVSIGKILGRALLLFIVTLSLSILYYAIFALCFSTQTERRLAAENRMYSKMVPQMQEKERLLSDVVENLQLRDNGIYEEIFHTAAPSLDMTSSLAILNSLDSIPDDQIVKYSEKKLKKMSSSADRVEENFAAVFESISKNGKPAIPMTNPLSDFSFARTGASVSDKINPFYKVPMKHNGLDMIAHTGEPVYAAADGVVEDVTRSRKGLGNVVTILHQDGYRTRYAHLSDISVIKGRQVFRGSKIGCVGVSGNSFAPHLHYEVLRDSLVLDPINYMFASVNPDEYLKMMILSVNTGQSMD